MKRQLKDRKWLVTGASSGIGSALARRLAAAGVELLITARRHARLQALQQQLQPLGAAVHTLAGDLTQPDFRGKLVQWIEQNWACCDGLINNAGIGAIGPFAAAPADRLRKIMDINFFAPVELTRDCLPGLTRAYECGHHPLIVNINSVLGYVAVPDKSEYCASKFALRAWSESLSFELAPQIDLLLVSPSSTHTEFFDAVIDSPPRFKVNSRQMSPDEVARQTVEAIQSGQRELILSLGGRSLVRAHRWFPWLMRPFVARARLVPPQL